MAYRRQESTVNVHPNDENMRIYIQDIQKMKVKDLRESLKSRGLQVTGLKKELQDRLAASILKEKAESKAVEKVEAMQEVIDLTDDVETEVDSEEPDDNPMAMDVENHVENDVSITDATNGLIQSEADLVVTETIDDEIAETNLQASEIEMDEDPVESEYSSNEFEPLILQPTTKAQHFSEEVAVPAPVQLAVYQPSPKKKHNALGKMIKATSKLFSPKRNKDKSPKKDKSPTQIDVETFVDSKQPHVPNEPVSNSVNGTTDTASLAPTVAEIVVQPSYHAFQPMLESAYKIPSLEKTFASDNSSAFARKLSAASRSSASSSSSSAVSRIGEVRKRVQEELALKAQEVSFSASTNQPSAVKSAGDQTRHAEMREKMRVSTVLFLVYCPC